MYLYSLISGIEKNGKDQFSIVLSKKKFDDVQQKLDVRFDLEAFDVENVNRFSLRIPAEDGEKVFGGGAQFTHLDLRKGGVYPLWVREQVSQWY